MANVYVGTSSAGAANGTSWADRYGTLNAAEDRPLSAGDTVYVGPGTYRELLTVDTSGTAGNPITYIGDYAGANTDGAGGIVRITGAANETTVGTRNQCIAASGKSYRTFRGFQLDGMAVQAVLLGATGCTNIIIDQCVFVLTGTGTIGIQTQGAAQSAIQVTNCVFVGNAGTSSGMVYLSHSATVDNAAHVVSGCLFQGHRAGSGSLVRSDRIGGVTVKNSSLFGGAEGVRVSLALTVGQTVAVNNCLVWGSGTGLQATTTAEFSEDYNSIFGCATARSNVTAGANSVAYPPGFDMRPYFEAFNAGTLVLPLASLASYSGLVEYSAGTGAPSTDWRGHAVAGSLREWGAEEYASGYTVDAGGGGIVVSPIGQQLFAYLTGQG